MKCLRCVRYWLPRNKIMIYRVLYGRGEEKASLLASRRERGGDKQCGSSVQ